MNLSILNQVHSIRKPILILNVKPLNKIIMFIPLITKINLLYNKYQNTCSSSN